ncbi:TniQ family protein [Mesorhizobium sp.]|uniref:TniQ family protein n=1 Tax=Mesorhizobium sp. TaxID=1871066 RepID=UPI0025FC6D73|nr:TniQ family protein [Mesorhizobium sp.]
MENTREPQLPVRLPPHSDELLSSWISRHAAFYAVPPLVMLRHCLPEVPSLRSADLHLSGADQIRLTHMFAIERAVLRRMTFTSAPRLSHRLIAARPAQTCASCSPSWRGTVANAKPIGGMADHLPALRNIAARARRW